MDLHSDFAAANEQLLEARRGLITLMAEQRRAARDIEALEADIARYEGYVSEALDKHEDTLAQDIAEKIAGMESSLRHQCRINEVFDGQVTRLAGTVRRLDSRRRGETDRVQYILDCLDAWAELEDGASPQLERRMREAGITERSNAGRRVLERIRTRSDDRE